MLHHQHPYMLHSHIKPASSRLIHINKTVNGAPSHTQINSANLSNAHLVGTLNRSYAPAPNGHLSHQINSPMGSVQQHLNTSLAQQFAPQSIATMNSPPISTHSLLGTIAASQPLNTLVTTSPAVTIGAVGPSAAQALPTPVPVTTHNTLINVPIAPSQLSCSFRRDCLRLRGLPYEAQVEQILEFLGEYSTQIVLQGVHMVLSSSGQASGEAFIQMRSETAAAAAALDKHHQYMQLGKKQRYIEVFQCSAQDMAVLLGTPMQLPFAQPSSGTLAPPPPSLQSVSATAPRQVIGQGAPQHIQYSQQFLYWTYPSPPVSPTTYYNTQSTLMALM